MRTLFSKKKKYEIDPVRDSQKRTQRSRDNFSVSTAICFCAVGLITQFRRLRIYVYVYVCMHCVIVTVTVIINSVLEGINNIVVECSR
jgi:hypothetical protein